LHGRAVLQKLEVLVELGAEHLVADFAHGGREVDDEGAEDRPRGSQQLGKLGGVRGDLDLAVPVEDKGDICAIGRVSRY
jgi:hypothetical protein